MIRNSFLLISLLMAYLSFGQINGTGVSCSDAIELDHSQATSCTNNNNQGTIWYSFIASTNIMELTVHEFVNEAEITLYSGSCSSLNQVHQAFIEYMSYDSLNIGTTYYIKVVGETGGNIAEVCLSNFYGDNPEPSEVCETIPTCIKAVNGDFNTNTSTYSSIDTYTGQNRDFDAFTEGKVLSWAKYLASPDLYVDDQHHARMWCKTSTSEVRYSEAIIGCTEILADELYFLSLDYARNYISAYAETHSHPLSVVVDIADNEVDGFQDVSGMFPTFTSSTQNIYYSTAFNTGAGVWTVDQGQFFTNNTGALMDRVIVSGDSRIGTPQRFFVDNISITPIIYEDIATCEGINITLEPTCLPEIQSLAQYSDFQFQWTSSVTGSIIAGGNTLTPTIDVTGSPLLTLTVTYNGQSYATDVQITDGSIQIIVEEITHELCQPDQNGAIDVTVIGGTPNYTFSWECVGLGYTNTLTNQPATGGDISGLTHGTYALTVTDAYGCTAEIDKIGVYQPTQQATPNSTDTWENESCGSVEANPIGGSGGYTWHWTDASGVTIGNTQVVTGLPTGDYFYTVTDNLTGCAASNTNPVTVGIGTGGNLADVDKFLCEGGSVVLGDDLAAYDDYNWSTGSQNQTITVTEFGEYTVNVFSDGGCRAQRTYNVNPTNAHIQVRDFQGNCQLFGSEEKNPLTLTASLNSTYISYQWQLTTYDDNSNVISVGAPYTGNYETFIQLPDNPNINHGIVSLTMTLPTGCVIVREVTIYKFDHIFTGDLIISNNTTWENKNYVFDGDLIVNNGITLNLINCHLEFTPGHKLAVSEKQTRLIVDNTSLSNVYCDDVLWKGVSLIGDATMPHSISDQPSILVDNQAVIEHAHIGIQSVKGAVVESYNSEFLNNNIAISLEAYSKDNGSNSYIKNNIFETNQYGELITDLDVNTFINMNKFSDMHIATNIFRNTNFATLLADRGKAIYSYSVPKVWIENGNHFERLHHAVQVNISSFLNLEGNTFENNWRGAYLNSIKAATALNNTFDDAMLTPTNHAFQMDVTGCTEPIIALNSFNNGVVGLHLGKVNIGSFQIYKNTFTGFDIQSNGNSTTILDGYPAAILNEADNGTFDTPWSPATGAEIKCNTFTDYDYAIAVMSKAIKGTQGANGLSPSDPAGNQFIDDETIMQDGRFFVSTAANQSQYKYYRHEGDVFKPELYSGSANINVMANGVTFDDNPTNGSCPDQVPALLLNIVEKKEAVDSKTAEISTKSELLTAKVDQGNTELLLSDIALATDDNFTALVEEIETVDSYLSDATAIEFMEKPTARPVAKAIGLIANSPLPSKAKSKIADLDMDENLKQYILASQNGLSKREKDEKEIHNLKLQKYRLLREAEQMAYQNGDEEVFNQVVDLLLEQDEWQQKERALHLLKNSARKDELTALFLELQQDLVKFDGDKRYHMENYLNMLELEYQLEGLSNDLRIAGITANQDLLEGIINSEFTEGRVAAELLLEEAGLKEKEALNIQLPNPEDAANRSANKTPQQAKAYHFANTPDLIEVYPNPVDDKLTVEYLMFGGMTANSISIYDINGKLMMSQPLTKAMGIIDVNVSQLSAGTYIIAFGKDGAKASSTKFIVK